MKHDDIRHMLSEYIDGAVTRKEKTAIESHLKTCTECSNALAELKKTIEHIKKVEEVDSPAWMTPKIMAKVRAEAEHKKSVFQRLFYPLAIKLPIQAVAVLFLAITAFYIYQSINPMEKYAEAPGVIAPKKEPPAASTSMNEQKIKRDSSPTAKQAPQAPGYKSLDMKYMYEKPAIPPPVKSKPSRAPAEQPARGKDKIERFAAAPQAPVALEQDLIKEREAPALAKRQEAVSPSVVGAVAKDEAAGEAAPAPKAKTLLFAGKKATGFILTVTVKDVDTAGKEIEKAVAQLNGRIINVEFFENKRIITVRLISAKFKELADKLKHIGDVKEKRLSSLAQEGDIDIRVELLKAPTQK